MTWTGRIFEVKRSRLL